MDLSPLAALQLVKTTYSTRVPVTQSFSFFSILLLPLHPPSSPSSSRFVDSLILSFRLPLLTRTQQA